MWKKSLMLLMVFVMGAVSMSGAVYAANENLTVQSCDVSCTVANLNINTSGTVGHTLAKNAEATHIMSDLQSVSEFDTIDTVLVRARWTGVLNLDGETIVTLLSGNGTQTGSCIWTMTQSDEAGDNYTENDATACHNWNVDDLNDVNYSITNSDDGAGVDMDTTFLNIDVETTLGEFTAVSSCQTISSAGNYKMTQSISGGDDCITIAADNVHLNCNGYTITYSTDAGNDENGITANGFDFLNVSDCNIVHGDGSGTGTIPFDIRNANHVNVSNVTTNAIAGDENSIYGGFFVTVTNASIRGLFTLSGVGSSNYGFYIQGGGNYTIRDSNFSSAGTTDSFGFRTNGDVNHLFMENVNMSSERTTSVNNDGFLMGKLHNATIINTRILADTSTGSYGIRQENFGGNRKFINSSITAPNAEDFRVQTSNGATEQTFFLNVSYDLSDISWAGSTNGNFYNMYFFRLNVTNASDQGVENALVNISSPNNANINIVNGFVLITDSKGEIGLLNLTDFRSNQGAQTFRYQQFNNYSINISHDNYTNLTGFPLNNSQITYLNIELASIIPEVLPAGFLDVTLQSSNIINVTQNDTFAVQAIATCEGTGGCGAVDANIYFNWLADISTLINVTIGDVPFYNSTNATNNTATLADGQAITVIVELNATGEPTSTPWQLTMNFTNSSEQNGTGIISVNISHFVPPPPPGQLNITEPPAPTYFWPLNESYDDFADSLDLTVNIGNPAIVSTNNLGNGSALMGGANGETPNALGTTQFETTYDAITVSGWLNLTNTTLYEGNEWIIFEQRGGAPDPSFIKLIMQPNASADQIPIQWFVSDEREPTPTDYTVSFNIENFVDRDWIQIVAVANATEGNMTLWIDGVNVNSTGSSGFAVLTGNFSLGSDSSHNKSFLPAMMDRWRVYINYTANESEVLWLAKENETLPPPPPPGQLNITEPPAPTYFYPLNESFDDFADALPFNYVIGNPQISFPGVVGNASILLGGQDGGSPDIIGNFSFPTDYTAITISLWTNITNTTNDVGNKWNVFEQGETAGHGSTIFGLSGSPDPSLLELQWLKGDGASPSGDHQIRYNIENWVERDWIHFVFIANETSGNISAWVDGINVNSTIISGFGSEGGNFSLGGHDSFNSSFFAGRIDRLRIYINYTANESEILWLAKENETLPPPAPPSVDSCTDFETGATNSVDCTDACTIDAATNKGGADVEFSGDGPITITADITNVGDIAILDQCHVICDGGCVI